MQESIIEKEEKELPCFLLLIGMAGSGKTSFIKRLKHEMKQRNRKSFVINTDPGVLKLPYKPNIDIRDTVDYKEVMKHYQLGPNGGILTALNLFTTKFGSVLDLIAQKDKLEYVLMDTPGQIEIFTWSASGQIMTESINTTAPSLFLYILDTPKSLHPVTFVSNMLYCCSIFYKSQIPFLLVLNKSDLCDAAPILDWLKDFESFHQALQEEGEEGLGYMQSLVLSMGLVLEEFYQCFQAVVVSAMTGAGMDAFFEKLAVVQKEAKDVFDERQRMMKSKEEEKQKQVAKEREIQMQKMIKDMKVEESLN